MKALLKIAGYPGYNPPKQAPDSRKINQSAANKNMNKLQELAKEKTPKPPKLPKLK